MKRTIPVLFLAVCIAGLPKKVFSQNEKITIPAEVVVDKIRGGLLGQILGNLNGIPHEMSYVNEPGNVQNYIPALPDGAWTDDDTDFEWFYVFEMQKNRNAFLNPDYITRLWVERVNRGVWCSNRFVRYLMDIGIQPPFSGYTEFNPWAEFNVSGQFLCETFGLLAPAMPQTAAKIGLNYTTVAINGEPAQTTQFFTTMIATAYVESDINKILDAGIASLDSKSIIIQIMNDVKKWHVDHPVDWRQTRKLIHDKYTQENGRIRDRNGHELNTAAIVAALLYGEGDFQETLRHSFNFGWDADCNAATVGTIVGTVYGYRKMMTQSRKYEPLWQIVDRYQNTMRDNMPEDETITSFADRLIELFELVNENNGGSKKVNDNVVVYEISPEKPCPVIMLAPDRKDQLRAEFRETIKADLNSTVRDDRARAVFMAICLDLSEDMKKENTKKWKEACYDLSGYWKIMNNLFSGEFKKLIELSQKFEKQGFKQLKRKYEDREIYGDRAYWKDPKTLY